MKTALAALIRNDLRLFLSDRRAMMISIIVPVAIASFFGMILGGSGGGGSTAQSSIALLIADDDNSPISQEIIANLQKEPTFSIQRTTAEAARKAVNAGKSPVALLFPPKFGADASQAMFAGADAKRPEVKLLYDPSHGAEYQLARGLVMQQVMQVVSARAFSAQSAPENIDQQLLLLQMNPTMQTEDKAALTDLLQSLKRYYGRPSAAGAGNGFAPNAMQMPVQITDEALAAKDGMQISTVTHSFAGMAVQGVLFFAIDAALGIMRDRRMGLWKRLRAAPLSRGVLLGGKLISTALIALLIIGIIFAAGALLFRIRIGNIPGFALLCVCTAIMVAAFGLLVAALGRTEQQSRGYAVPAVLAMSILGGAWFPSFLMPAWVRTVSLVMPSRWAVDGFDAMTWRGFDFSTVILPSGMLLLFALVFGIIAFTRFRWDTE